MSFGQLPSEGVKMSTHDSTNRVPACSRAARPRLRGSLRARGLPCSAAVLLTAVAASGCKRPVQGAAAQTPATVEAPPPNPANNLLRNADFAESTLPWTTALTVPARGSSEVKDGALCVTIEDKGKNNW